MLRQVGIGSSRFLLRKTTSNHRYLATTKQNGGKVKGMLAKEQGMARKGGYHNTLKDRKKPQWLEEPVEDPVFEAYGAGGGYQLDKIGINKYIPYSKETLKNAALVVLGVLGLGQLSLGYAEDFFDYRFKVQNVDPDDLADFFGTEAAMDAFSVFPFISSFLMRRGAWDDEGTYRVPILLGDYLSARMEFEEREQNPKELTPQQEWEKFMTKSVKPGEDDDDDDEDEDEDDDDDEDEDDDEEGGGEDEEEEEGAATEEEETEGGEDEEEEKEDKKEEEEGEEEVTEEEEDEEKIVEVAAEVVPVLEEEEEVLIPIKPPTVLTRKATLALKRQATLGVPATTSNGGLWTWVKSRFGRKRQEVLTVALDVHEKKDKKEEKALKRKATVVTSEENDEDTDEIIIEGEDDDEEFDDDEDEEEEDDGPKMEFFVKKETLRFVESHIKKSLFHYELEMGFNLLAETNECEIFFRGTKFRGLFPIRLIFEVHALYFMWAMEKYFNSAQFRAVGDLPEEAEHYRLNIPAAAVTEYLYDLIKDVEHSRKVALANQASTKEHEQNIHEIKTLLEKAGYMGAEAVLVKAEDGKQQIMLNVSDKKAKAIIQRAHTLNALQRQGTGAAGATLARKMTLRIDEKKANASAIAAAVAASSEEEASAAAV